MKRSTDRILVTHVGSLPRPPDLLDVGGARGRGEAVDEAAYADRLREAVAGVVREQIEHGIDVVDDGEYSKPSFLTYVTDRLGGFERIEGSMGSPWAGSREALDFPEYYEAAHVAAAGSPRLACTRPVTYVGHAALRTDLENLASALDGAGATEAFVPAISPSNIEGFYENRHYATEEEYLFAIADAMREEYRAIVDAGFLLQIDDPRLVTYYVLTPSASIEDARRWAQTRVEALNHALRDIPPERVRHHTCYSIDTGPRVHDLEFRHIVDLVLRINAGAYSFEAANPRHEHEWQVWEDVELPADKVLIPGVITHSTVLVEHPELVAQRLARFAGVVGRERVIAGADCGFATFASGGDVPAKIAWTKLGALSAGARLASDRLWNRS
jgi:5-methyltetrahydropteroyltriglutamate--homocysteine methyltransferase